MFKLNRSSVRTQLVLRFGAFVGSFALFLAFSLPAQDASLVEQGLRQRALDLASVLGPSVNKALSEGREAEASELLASLGKVPGALAAGVRAPDGTLKARWSERKIPSVDAELEKAQVRVEGDKVQAFFPLAQGTLVVVFSRVTPWVDLPGRAWVNVLMGLVLFLSGSALAYALGSRLVNTLSELTRITTKIVDEGDLSQTFPTNSEDELGLLAKALGRMVGKLKDIPTSLHESVRMLDASVAHLDLSTQEQTDTVTRQAAALQETQVTAQEIKQTSLVAAQKAEMVLKVAERAESVTRAGEQAIEQSLNGLTDIRTQVEEVARKISALSERTRQIGLITQTVKDLADQSNMLALNAAIEAVRSGEHGKGFAVVAREIRSLADQSIEATNRVREILEDITTAINVAVTSSEKGAQKMEVGLGQVKASGENLRELSNIVKDNSSAVRQIAAAVSQQNAGITQIFTAVTELSTMMDDNVKRLEITTEAAATLKDASGKVSAVISSYRV